MELSVQAVYSENIFSYLENNLKWLDLAFTVHAYFYDMPVSQVEISGGNLTHMSKT